MQRSEFEIMMDIWDTYDQLSPERLSWDGELSRSTINCKRHALETRLKTLENELGRSVGEIEAWNWWIANKDKVSL